MLTARSVTSGLGGPFRVSGGPFACRSQFKGWLCTLEPGHAGDHQAAGDLAQQIVYARWPNVRFQCYGPITDAIIDEMLRHPDAWAARNPSYRKTHVNAPGTVRAWFRKMRAADFERHVARTVYGTFFIAIDQKPWTLFDTQTVVNRETAAYYLQPARDTIYFCNGGRVVGKIEGIDWSDITTCYERGGQPEWDMTDYRRDVQWLGLDRSQVIERPLAGLSVEAVQKPIFHSQVPTSGRGITRDDLKRFVSDDDLRRIGRSALQRAREDDARRSERRRQDGPADQFMAWLLRETDAGAWDPSVVAEVRDHLASLIRRSATR